MPHFMIVLIPYINLLNLSWIIKCLFLRNMEPDGVCLFNLVQCHLSDKVLMTIQVSIYQSKILIPKTRGCVMCQHYESYEAVMSTRSSAVTGI